MSIVVLNLILTDDKSKGYIEVCFKLNCIGYNKKEWAETFLSL